VTRPGAEPRLDPDSGESCEVADVAGDEYEFVHRSDRSDLTIDKRWGEAAVRQPCALRCVPLCCLGVVRQDLDLERDRIEDRLDRAPASASWKQRTSIRQLVPRRRGGCERRWAMLVEALQHARIRDRPGRLRQDVGVEQVA
jgi:hypothetical protein